MQVVQVDDSKDMDPDVDEFKKSRRLQAKSLDISSKAFIPTKRASSNKSKDFGNPSTNMTYSTHSGISPSHPFEMPQPLTSEVPNLAAYEIYNKQMAT